MTTTHKRSHRLRALAAVVGVGLVVFCGANTPVSADPGDSGGPSNSDASNSSGGQSADTPRDTRPDHEGSAGVASDDGEGASGDTDSGGTDSGDTDSGGNDSGGTHAETDPTPGGNTRGDDTYEIGPQPGDTDQSPASTDFGSTSSGAPDSSPGDTSAPSASEPAVGESPAAAEVATDPQPGDTETRPAPNTPTEDKPARRPTEDATHDVEAHESPGDAAGSPDTASVPGSEPGHPDAAVMAALMPDSPPNVTPRISANTSTPTVVALGPHPKRTGAIGLLAFLGFNVLGSGTTGAVSPAPWTLVWWVRRFGTVAPVSIAAPPSAPTHGLLLDDPRATGDTGTISASEDRTPSPEPVPSFAALPAGVLSGAVTFRDPDGNPLPATPVGLTAVGDTTYRTELGGICTVDPLTGGYTYSPCLRARVAASADDASESARFDPLFLRAGGPYGTSVRLGLAVDSPYSAGQVTVPGRQIDDIVAGPAGTWFVTTHDGDRTFLTVVAPDATSATIVPIPGEPAQGVHGVVLGPDGRAHQVTQLDEIVGEDLRSTVRITSVDASGSARTTARLPGRPRGGLQFGPDGTGYLLTFDEDPTGLGTTHLTSVAPTGETVSSPVPGGDGHLLVTGTGDVRVAVVGTRPTILHRLPSGDLVPTADPEVPEGGILWDHREVATYFVTHVDDAPRPHSALTAHRADGTTVTHDALPGRVTSVVSGEHVDHVLSESAGAAHITTLAADGRRSVVDFPGMVTGSSAIGPGDALFAALTDPLTDETIVVTIGPDGTARPVTSTVGLAEVHTNRLGDVFVVATTMTADGRDTSTVTVVRADGRTAIATGFDGTPISVQFNRFGDIAMPVLTTDETTGDALTSFAVIRPDATVVASPAVAGEPAGEPTIADDGTSFVTLTRFDRSTRRPNSTVVSFGPDGRAAVAAEFPGHSLRGPAISAEDNLAVVTHDDGSATIRVLGARRHRSGHASPTKVFDVIPHVVGVDPTTGTVTGTLDDGAPDESALGFLTTDAQVQLDPVTGTFVFTPTPEERAVAAGPDGPTTHNFTVLVSDANGASTVLSVTVPVSHSPALQSLD
ncbi:RHS repeat domain-containing protein [Gordonia aurantiaca]|uniref:hypothetical protein n=1 Tax=Gordonia sp. B21 TaxID=3151852 RepID=UPI0032661AD5